MHVVRLNVSLLRDNFNEITAWDILSEIRLSIQQNIDATMQLFCYRLW